MRLLLDTHALIWIAQDPDRVPEAAWTAINDEFNTVCVSAASAWEIATKYRLGKLAVSPRLAEDFVEQVGSQGLAILPISAVHAQRAGLLPILHRDPFDRLLIAQTMIEGMTLVSNEAKFDEWFVPRLWSKPLYRVPS